MQPGGGGPLQVVGEDEALQQFFDGQDVNGVLESSVAVDTSILEQYLSNDMDPSSFMLPDSPPDSSSDPCSPPQVPDLQYEPHHWSTQHANQYVFQPMAQPSTSFSCRFKDRGPTFTHPELPTHAQLCSMGLTKTRIKADTHTHTHTHYLSPESPVHNPLPPSQAHAPPHLAPADSYPGPQSGPSRSPQGASPQGASLQVASPQGASPQGASLQVASPQGASLQVASPQGASLQVASPQGASLQVASPQGASLQVASPQGASLQVASPQGASLQVASPQGASLQVASPQGASLQGASPQGASLQGPSPPACMLGPSAVQPTGSPVQPGSKRRRCCGCEGVGDSSCCDSDGSGGGGADGGGVGVALGPYQTLTWDQYRPEQWSSLYDSSYRTLPPPAFQVETDKGFNYSAADEAFVCQKKNHFQVTVHIGVVGEPCYVTTPSGPQQIHHFLLKVFGLKPEAPGHHVTIEQSQADRSKRPFHPVRISLPGNKITKVTLGRLHFSETTANNMRKKGKPNPDQRYFVMVVGLYAAGGQESCLLSALVSDRTIVRASNPGQFEVDGDTLWQRGAQHDGVVCRGRVGINTDCPDEALVVCGNAKVMGLVMHPSDCRAKHNIQEVDSKEQLKRIAQMRIVQYDYKPGFASTMGIDHTHQTGVIAQEVRELLPTAVKEVGDVTCCDGEKIHNFLMVDKEQIFMENVGAVKQLCKMTDNLEGRIKDLEVWNSRLAKLKSLSGSLRSNGNSIKHTSLPIAQRPDPTKTWKESWAERFSRCLHHKVFQAGVFLLLATMAICMISVTASYLVTLREDNMDALPGNSSGSNVFPLQTTTASPSPPPGPPHVDFCQILYCEQVYCCPSTAGGSVNTTSTTTTEAPDRNQDPALADKSKEQLFDELKNARDWTNTTIQVFMIKENEQVIDSRYCDRDSCGLGKYRFQVPVSRHVPVNMRITLLMNSTELLVVHLCSFDESASCSALLDIDPVTTSRYPSNTQGVHEWPLHVARLHHSLYHFRSTAAGQADCSTDPNYAGALFTDYYFYFYRHCTG
ncbi:myelin regulatory factor-like protein [Polymixia lowei]